MLGRKCRLFCWREKPVVGALKFCSQHHSPVGEQGPGASSHTGVPPALWRCLLSMPPRVIGRHGSAQCKPLTLGQLVAEQQVRETRLSYLPSLPPFLMSGVCPGRPETSPGTSQLTGIFCYGKKLLNTLHHPFLILLSPALCLSLLAAVSSSPEKPLEVTSLGHAVAMLSRRCLQERKNYSSLAKEKQ